MCALVKGMTDILTPINILPNSDFSRDGGYASTQTWAAPASGNSNYNYVAYNVSIIFYIGTFTNVTVTRSKNSIRVSGTYSGSNNNLRVNFNNVGLHKYVNFYTITSKVIDNLGNISGIAAYVQTDGIIVHQRFDKVNNTYYPLMIESTTTEGAQNVRLASINFSGASGSFDFTISDCRIYQGQFCNPPIIDSLDVMPGHQFILKEELDYLSTNACLCKYMATAIDTSAALTTTGCIKDISGNVHHTQVNSSSNGTVPYISDCGKVIQSISTRTEAYAFNTKNIGIQLTNDGTYDELTSFTRFKYVNRASSLDNTNKACGLEWSLASSGGAQAARWNYWYVRDGTTKIGVCINIKNGKRESDLTTISFGHMYAVMWSVSLIKGLRTIYIYDITDNKIIFSESITILTKDSGNQWNLNNSTNPNHRPYLFLASGASVLLMESAMYSCYMNRDNFNYLVDNYHPEIGAAYLGA